MSSQYQTSYFQSDSPILASLSTPKKTREFEDILGFRIDAVSLHDALVFAYDSVIAEDTLANRNSLDLESRITAQTLIILHKRNSIGHNYAKANERYSNNQLPYTPRAIQTSMHQHKEFLPVVAPRPANTLGLNTRHSATPMSNRSLSNHQLVQMRGVATAALSSAILSVPPPNRLEGRSLY